MTGPQDENEQAAKLTDKKYQNAQALHAEGGFIEIRVRGHLGREWSDWFEDLVLQPLENGEMVLSGHIVDQAALIGILTNLNRLNLALISIRSSEE